MSNNKDQKPGSTKVELTGIINDARCYPYIDPQVLTRFMLSKNVPNAVVFAQNVLAAKANMVQALISNFYQYGVQCVDKDFGKTEATIKEINAIFEASLITSNYSIAKTCGHIKDEVLQKFFSEAGFNTGSFGGNNFGGGFGGNQNAFGGNAFGGNNFGGGFGGDAFGGNNFGGGFGGNQNAFGGNNFGGGFGGNNFGGGFGGNQSPFGSHGGFGNNEAL